MQKNRLVKFLLIVVCITALFATDTCFGEGGMYNWYIAPAGFYQSDTLKQNSSWEDQTMSGDIRLGYQIMSDIYIGGIYAVENSDIAAKGYTDSSDNYTKKTQRTSYGGTLAYIFGAPFVMASYFPKSTWAWSSTSSSGQRNLIYDGWGWDVHVGYRFTFGGLLLGPEFVYRSWTYTSRIENSANQVLEPSLKESRIDPMISAWYAF